MSDDPSYRVVLRTRHIARSFIPSIVGRLSLATSGLALVLLLEESTGSFAIAGAVTATLGVANVAVTPWRARLIDRRGQAGVMSVLALAHGASLIALGVLPRAGLPVLLCLAVVAGASAPPFAAGMRVLWSAALPVGGLRTRGLSLDAVAGEVTFAVGPLIAALLAVVVDPLASLVLSAACVAVGAALFVTSPLSRRQRGSRLAARDRRDTRSPLRSRGFPPIVFAMIAPGLILGFVEIAAPAIADAESNTFLAGVLLALFAGASGASGLLYGRLELRPAVERQLLLAVVALIAILVLTGITGGAVPALIGFTLSGFCLAPALIVGYLAADSRPDPRVRTEANGWIDTAVNLGAAVGALVFGALADLNTPGAALAISVALPGLVIAICAPYLLRARCAS